MHIKIGEIMYLKIKLFLNFQILLLMFIISITSSVYSQGYKLDWQKIIEKEWNDWGIKTLDVNDGLVIVGYNYVNDSPNLDIMVYKTDCYGNSIWTRQFGGSFEDRPQTALLSSKNEIIISAFTDSTRGCWLFALDSSGDLQWEHFYDDTQIEQIFQLKELSDHSLIGAGSVITFRAAGGRDNLITSLSNTGEIQWRHVPGRSSKNEQIENFILMPDKSWIYSSGNERSDGMITKLDSLRNIEWTQKIETGQVIGPHLFNIDIDNILYFYSDYNQLYIQKYDPFGTEIWEKRIDRHFSLLQTVKKLKNGTYLVVSQNGILMNIDSDGNLIWNQNVGISPITSLEVLLNDNIILTGLIENEGNLYQDIIISHLSPVEVVSLSGELSNKNKYTLFQNYPNPFNPSTKINYQLNVKSNVTLIVYDMIGKTVKTLVNEFQFPGEHSVTFDANDLSSGVYYYKLKAGNFEQSRKMLLLR